MIIKQSTQYGRLFMMIQSSDHIGGFATGATVAVELTKCAASTGTTTVGAATNSPATAVDTVNMPGLYKLVVAISDTGTVGDLAFHCTASGADPTDFIDQVQSQWFPDLQINASGQALIASQVKQNTQFLLPFIMTVSGVPTGSLTGFVAQRNLAGGGFAPCANTVVEDGAGWYHILLASTDTNATVVEIHITAPTADDRNITLYTQP